MKSFRYSLVELLTVVVIASILLSIAIPSFTRIMKGTASTQAGRELMGRIHAARSYAISSSSSVGLVFYANERPSGNLSKVSENYAYSAYRFCKVIYDGENKKWVFQSWIGEWYFLPKGVAVGLPVSLSAAIPTDMFSDPGASAETEEGLIRLVDQAHMTPGTAETADDSDYYTVSSTVSPGNSPVYLCDVSDLFSSGDYVTFRNAIVFNSKGMMEKPRNLTIQDTSLVLTHERAVIIPLRETLIEKDDDSFTSTPLHSDGLSDYIPVRVEPSGKTSFYDGYCPYP